MPHIRVLGKGARITGGILCLLFALHTWIWVLRDFIELGPDNVWKTWSGALGRGAGSFTEMPATTSADLGLGLLQLAAVFAAFTGAWAAGGLMAATTALTFAYRLPVIWAAALHSESSPFYAVRDFYNDDSLDAAAGSSVLAVLLCVVLAIVLLAGIRPWPRPAGPPAPTGWPGHGQPQPYGQPQPAQPPMPPEPEPPLPGECPQRPTGPHAAVAALFLAVVVVFNIGWTAHALFTTGGRFGLSLFTGENVVFSLLDVPPGWSWLTAIFLAGTGSVLALARVVSARGFTLGLAIALLPTVVVALWALFDAGMFFELGDPAPVVTFFSRADGVVTLVGTVALVVLALRPGVPAQPRTPGQPVAPFAGGPGPFGGGPAPFGAPQGQPQPYLPQQGPAQPYVQQPPQPPNFPPQPAPAPPPQPGQQPGEQPGQPGGGFGPPPPPAN